MSGRQCPSCVLAACLLVLLGGCKAVDCGEYYPYSVSPGHRAEVVSWVDTHLMAQPLDPRVLWLGQMPGPGKRAVSLQTLGVMLPAGLEGAEVRILGPDPTRPAAVFIGRRRYQGVLIARESMPAALPALNLTPDVLDAMNGRVAVMCYQEKENLAPQPR